MRWLIWTRTLWSQDLCAVCAVDVRVVDDALAFLGCRAKVVTIDPHTLAEVDESILRLGEVTGRRASSQALVSSIQQRMTHVAERVKARPRPRVAVLEWTDPPVAPRALDPRDGLVGQGDPVIGAAGAASRRIS
jgi:iron complex transport system substrate-binding protein